MQSKKKESWQNRAGAYFVAFGEPARKCLTDTAIPAFRKHMPGVKIAVASDEPLGCEDIFIEAPDSDIGGRLAKLHAYEWTPQEWEYVLYMDADTEVLASPAYLFQILREGWEFAICRHWGKHSIRSLRGFQKASNLDEYKATVNEIGTDRAMFYQSGVFAFRRTPATRQLFDRWVSEWKRWGTWDQGALSRAIHACPVKLFLLAPHWNRNKRKKSKSGTVIAHYYYRARRFSYRNWKKVSRFDAPDAWENFK